jgi:hypothetical protein
MVEVLRDMMTSRIGLIEGARMFYQLAVRAEMVDDAALRPMIGFAAVTDDFLIGETREHWAPAFIAELDLRMESYLSKERDGVLRDCENIIEYLEALP